MLGEYPTANSGLGDTQRLNGLVEKVRKSVGLRGCCLTAKYAYPVNLLACWQIGEKEPWFLATNLVCPQTVMQAYRRRMGIEEMYGDMKGHGFDLEKTHLRHFLRLSRLTLAVSCYMFGW
ncbi:MAG: hypothetical protein IBX69_17400 [Anaerolineales bacterium]|nr:hypothetical protein [Anaerolineales bacterium]